MDLSISQNLQLSAGQIDQSRVSSLQKKAENSQDIDYDKLGKVAEEFEAIFLELMLRSMRNTIEKSGLIDGGNAEDIFQGMLDFEYAKSLSSQRMSGIADNIERQLLGKREQTKNMLNRSSGYKAYEYQALQAIMKEAKIEENR